MTSVSAVTNPTAVAATRKDAGARANPDASPTQAKTYQLASLYPTARMERRDFVPLASAGPNQRTTRGKARPRPNQG